MLFDQKELLFSLMALLLSLMTLLFRRMGMLLRLMTQQWPRLKPPRGRARCPHRAAPESEQRSRTDGNLTPAR